MHITTLGFVCLAITFNFLYNTHQLHMEMVCTLIVRFNFESYKYEWIYFDKNSQITITSRYANIKLATFSITITL